MPDKEWEKEAQERFEAIIESLDVFQHELLKKVEAELADPNTTSHRYRLLKRLERALKG